MVRHAATMVVCSAGLLSVRTASMIAYLRHPGRYILPILDVQSSSRYSKRLADYVQLTSLEVQGASLNSTNYLFRTCGRRRCRSTEYRVTDSKVVYTLKNSMSILRA